jgi:hypothetical protein
VSRYTAAAEKSHSAEGNEAMLNRDERPGKREIEGGQAGCDERPLFEWTSPGEQSWNDEEGLEDLDQAKSLGWDVEVGLNNLTGLKGSESEPELASNVTELSSESKPKIPDMSEAGLSVNTAVIAEGSEGLLSLFGLQLRGAGDSPSRAGDAKAAFGSVSAAWGACTPPLTEKETACMASAAVPHTGGWTPVETPGFYGENRSSPSISIAGLIVGVEKIPSADLFPDRKGNHPSVQNRQAMGRRRSKKPETARSVAGKTNWPSAKGTGVFDAISALSLDFVISEFNETDLHEEEEDQNQQEEEEEEEEKEKNDRLVVDDNGAAGVVTE